MRTNNDEFAHDEEPFPDDDILPSHAPVDATDEFAFADSESPDPVEDLSGEYEPAPSEFADVPVDFVGEDISGQPGPFLFEIEGIDARSEFRDDPITEAVRSILQSHCAPYSDSTKLKDMGGANTGVRRNIAHDIDARFPNLNPRFTVADVKADDTLATLAERVAGRFPV